MLSVRSILLLAWLTLIASLFWDPYSASLTEPGNAASPFRILNDVVQVRGEEVRVEPYPMGARIFWTMIVPIVPIFLMVFGHEAWRRVCPLSLASQIPGYLGLRRYRSWLDRRSGLIRRTFAVLDRQSWLARNSWYVQFSLLFAGVTMRLLLINTDREAMGIALLTVICAAMATGMLWGGKTWCNYFCPANVVQKIYTEPGGILESAPHFTRPALPQSMCRTPSAKGDVSACVGCATNCGDIDLQRSYWYGAVDPQRRNVYYMFFGLICGFYGYYYLYSGSWQYYFSGVWTHEDGIRQKLLAPGFFILGHSYPIPKVLAAPLTLATACLLALALGRALEALYRNLRSRGEGISEKIIVHHCLSVSAWLSINTFYGFGGRPNILLLPSPGGWLFSIAILILTTIWLHRSLQHSPVRYQQESMASSLLTELKKLKLDLGRFLDGRRLDDLKVNEIYLLSKVLPDLSKQQKLNAYRKILDEAVTKGATASSSAVKLLEDFRSKMNITEEEHSSLLDEIGLVNVNGEDDNEVTNEEKAGSLVHYQSFLGNAVSEGIEKGYLIDEIIKDPTVRSTIEVLRQSLQISEAEHQGTVQALASETGIVNAKMEEVLDTLLHNHSVRLCMESAEITDPLGRTLMTLLLDALDAQEQTILIKALSILRNFELVNAQRHAEDLASLSSHGLDLVLRQPLPSGRNLRWREALHPKILAILTTREPSIDIEDEGGLVGRRRTHRKAVLASLDVESNLSQLLTFEDPLLRAVGLVICGYIRPVIARKAAEQMLTEESISKHPLLMSTVEHMANITVAEEPGMHRTVIRARIHLSGHPERDVRLDKDFITIGRAADNDIAISDSAVWSYHVAIRVLGGEVRLIRVGEGVVFVNGKPVHEESIILRKGSSIALDKVIDRGPQIVVDWDNVAGGGNAFPVHPVLRLAMLAQNDRLSHVPLATLADIAAQSQVERLIRGAKLQSTPEEEQYVLVNQGEIRLFDPLEMDFSAGVAFGPGDVIGADLTDARSAVVPEVVSDFAVVLHVPPTVEVRMASHRHQFRGPPAAHAPRLLLISE